MKKKTKRVRFDFQAKGSPVVEMDTEAGAAYVRFNRNPVAKTVVVEDEGFIITTDCDADGDVIGVEIIGVDEFTIDRLAELGHFEVPDSVAKRTKYVSATATAAA